MLQFHSNIHHFIFSQQILTYSTEHTYQTEQSAENTNHEYHLQTAIILIYNDKVVLI